jgi:predicted transcriptional regulator
MKKIAKTPIHVRIDTGTHAQLLALAAAENRTISNLVDTALMDFINPESRRLAPPFNATSRATFEATDRGEGLTHCTSAEDMFARLGS